MNFVIGAHGLLGQEIAASLPYDKAKLLDRSIYQEWWRDRAENLISEFIERHAENEGTIFLASGILDPLRPRDEHYRINYMLPRNVIVGATMLGFRVVTFGTVMERFYSLNSSNPYYESKIQLGRFIDEFSEKSDLALHIRMHTLFGKGLPHAFMFLGQIFRSISDRTIFKMSSGLQLREYHHIEDEIKAITRLHDSHAKGVIELNHGDPLVLKDLAVYIFTAFKVEELLMVGALPSPPDDNYGEVLPRTPALDGISFRKTLPALIVYFRQLLNDHF